MVKCVFSSKADVSLNFSEDVSSQEVEGSNVFLVKLISEAADVFNMSVKLPLPL